MLIECQCLDFEPCPEACIKGIEDGVALGRRLQHGSQLSLLGEQGTSCQLALGGGAVEGVVAVPGAEFLNLADGEPVAGFLLGGGNRGEVESLALGQHEGIGRKRTKFLIRLDA